MFNRKKKSKMKIQLLRRMMTTTRMKMLTKKVRIVRIVRIARIARKPSRSIQLYKLYLKVFQFQLSPFQRKMSRLVRKTFCKTLNDLSRELEWWPNRSFRVMMC